MKCKDKTNIKSQAKKDERRRERGTQMAGRGGRMGGRRQRDGLEVDALDVFLLFHQQKPVGGKAQ